MAANLDRVYDRLLRRIGVARHYDAVVGGVKPVSVTLHGVFCSEGGDCDLCVFVDNSGFDLMGIHLPALGVTALVPLWI